MTKETTVAITMPVDPPPSYNAVFPPDLEPSFTSVVTRPASPFSKQIAVPAALTPGNKLEYNQQLSEFGITPSAWASFTHELHRAASPTAAQKTLAWSAGIGCGLLAPGTGRLVGYAIWRSQVKRKLSTELFRAETEMDGIRSVLQRYGKTWSIDIDVEILENEEARKIMMEEALGRTLNSTDTHQPAVRGCGAQKRKACSGHCKASSACSCHQGRVGACHRRCSQVQNYQDKQGCGSFFKRPVCRILLRTQGATADALDIFRANGGDGNVPEKAILKVVDMSKTV
jgi:hypothetical protein